MPEIRITIAPSTVAMIVEVHACRLCLRLAELVGPAGDPIAGVEYFLDGLGWRMLPDGDLVCDRCKVLPEIAMLLLAAGKARTQ